MKADEIDLDGRYLVMVHGVMVPVTVLRQDDYAVLRLDPVTQRKELVSRPCWAVFDEMRRKLFVVNHPRRFVGVAR